MKFLVFLVSGEERNALPAWLSRIRAGRYCSNAGDAQEKQIEFNTAVIPHWGGGKRGGKTAAALYHNDRRETMRTSSLFLRTVLYSKWSRF
jgi:hypothetical protein